MVVSVSIAPPISVAIKCGLSRRPVNTFREVDVFVRVLSPKEREGVSKGNPEELESWGRSAQPITLP